MPPPHRLPGNQFTGHPPSLAHGLNPWTHCFIADGGLARWMFVGVFCGCVLGVCGVWVGCVVFFVVAETAARQLEVSCLVVGCVGGWGGGSFTVCCFPVCGACLRLAGCGVRVSACCTCWCAGFWCAWFMCVRVLCENSIVCQCTFVLVAAGATVLWWLL